MFSFCLIVYLGLLVIVLNPCLRDRLVGALLLEFASALVLILFLTKKVVTGYELKCVLKFQLFN